jgi:hypothetical protein
MDPCIEAAWTRIAIQEAELRGLSESTLDGSEHCLLGCPSNPDTRKPCERSTLVQGRPARGGQNVVSSGDKL